MGPKRLFASRLSKEIAGWLCLLAVLALVTTATAGTLQWALTLAALVVAIWAVGLPRAGGSERPPRKPAPLYVVLVPVFVGLPIAYAIASEEWLAFTAVAIIFPLAVLWRHVARRWDDGRLPHTTA
jgi:uncharacterized membrane protein YhaH (DUF805 family)